MTELRHRAVYDGTYPLMPVMVYDVLLVDPCEPADLIRALAGVFAVPVSDVDAAAEDTDDRNWSAPVLVTYSERHCDVSLSLSITAVQSIADRPTEAVLAARLAERLKAPVLYPAEEFPPSAYWLADGQDRPARARLEPAEELDSSIEDERALRITAVDRMIPSLPKVRVTPIPEVIREHRLPTPLSAAFSDRAGTETGSPSWYAGNALAVWESFVTRMTSGWPPDGWYPAEYYAQDLQSRDDAGGYVEALTPELAAAMASALHVLDQTYESATIPDDGSALAEALEVPRESIAGRGPRWQRRPAELPWAKS